MDRIIQSARDGGGAFAAGVGSTIRDNPIPAVVLGAGLGWLLMSSRNHNSGRRAAGAGAAPRCDPHRPTAVARAAAPDHAPASPTPKAPGRQMPTETDGDIRDADPLGTP